MPLDKLKLAQEHLVMSDFIHDELLKNGVLDKFLSHPIDQQDNYLDWIASAPKGSVRDKRLSDMIAELLLEKKYLQELKKGSWLSKLGLIKK